MLNATPLPIDSYGNPQSVPTLKTRGTQPLTLTSNAVVYASTAFSGLTKTMATATILTDMVLTSLLEGYKSETISIQIATGSGSLTVAVTGNAILVTLASAGNSNAQIKAAIDANPAAAALVSVVAGATGSANNPVAKTYLNGWDRGDVGLYVRIWCDNDAFIGTFSEAETATKTASMPITAKQEYWQFVYPGDKIAAKSATNGAIIYFTPAKQE